MVSQQTAQIDLGQPNSSFRHEMSGQIAKSFRHFVQLAVQVAAWQYITAAQ
jgi:hypothetical protein